MEHDKYSVAQAVRRYLADHHPGKITMDVVEDGIRKEDHWWYVPIRPSAWPRTMFELYEALADVEEDLEEHQQLKVFLAAGEPLEAEAA